MSTTEQYGLESQKNSLPFLFSETVFSKMNRDEIRAYYERLKIISIDYDPFFSPIPSEDWKIKIEAAGLGKFIGDPFALTNELLYRLDVLENELKKEI